MTPTVTLYGRPGCHLCDDAREHLQRLRATTPFEIDEVDITSDDELHARYLERIPVIAVGGVELSDFFVDEPRLLDQLSLAPDELR
jgi:glutaredoxin